MRRLYYPRVEFFHCKIRTNLSINCDIQSTLTFKVYLYSLQSEAKEPAHLVSFSNFGSPWSSRFLLIRHRRRGHRDLSLPKSLILQHSTTKFRSTRRPSFLCIYAQTRFANASQMAFLDHYSALLGHHLACTVQSWALMRALAIAQTI